MLWSALDLVVTCSMYLLQRIIGQGKGRVRWVGGAGQQSAQLIPFVDQQLQQSRIRMRT